MDIPDNKKMTTYKFRTFYKPVSKDKDPCGARTLAKTGNKVDQKNNAHHDDYIATNVDKNSGNFDEDIDTTGNEDLNTITSGIGRRSGGKPGGHPCTRDWHSN